MDEPFTNFEELTFYLKILCALTAANGLALVLLLRARFGFTSAPPKTK